MDRGSLAQLGLFLLLASRFWQRGLEATLVMAADPPMVVTEELTPEEPLTMDAIAAMAEQDLPAAPFAGVSSGLSEPTLRDLVAKLHTEPWASPDVLPDRRGRYLNPERVRTNGCQTHGGNRAPRLPA